MYSSHQNFKTLCKCVNSIDNFCYIYGEDVFVPRNARLHHLLLLFWRVKLRDQDKLWAPRICCIMCSVILHSWLNKKGCSVHFTIPMIYLDATIPVGHAVNIKATYEIICGSNQICRGPMADLWIPENYNNTSGNVVEAHKVLFLVWIGQPCHVLSLSK